MTITILRGQAYTLYQLSKSNIISYTIHSLYFLVLKALNGQASNYLCNTVCTIDIIIILRKTVIKYCAKRRHHTGSSQTQTLPLKECCTSYLQVYFYRSFLVSPRTYTVHTQKNKCCHHFAILNCERCFYGHGSFLFIALSNYGTTASNTMLEIGIHRICSRVSVWLSIYLQLVISYHVLCMLYDYTLFYIICIIILRLMRITAHRWYCDCRNALEAIVRKL